MKTMIDIFRKDLLAASFIAFNISCVNASCADLVDLVVPLLNVPKQASRPRLKAIPRSNHYGKMYTTDVSRSSYKYVIFESGIRNSDLR